ncbi:MAG: SRPBCC domain-containing protein [Sphingomonas sp.]|uniref:SRPBCC family protein n=1 Tax=Sphingomonas sp. TaxID=28214 RepID=UPI00121C39C1|nr:SRPBCC domain-containing protein [Sphingomonas sp.]THD37485.1 MAG: SRPBCC domain-containing protein [Sphingomonas sp.]
MSAILTVTRDFAAPAERVFDAWLDPAQARHFLFRTPDGEMLTCEIDARVGGEAVIVERRGGKDALHRLRYETIERPRRLVFQFRACMVGEVDEGEWTRVTVAIQPQGAGSRLTLTHEGVWTDYEDRTRAGWTMILGNLATTTEQ